VSDLLPEISDVDLIQRMGTGDAEALSIFQRRHIGIIYSTAHRVLNNDTDAEDVTQEVLFMLWEKSPMYDISRGRPVTWLVTMTRNKAIDRLRSLQRRLRLWAEGRNGSSGACAGRRTQGLQCSRSSRGRGGKR
jgi:RNA polymerase sigma-70 factor (ECF subfamily)